MTEEEFYKRISVLKDHIVPLGICVGWNDMKYQFCIPVDISNIHRDVILSSNGSLRFEDGTNVMTMSPQLSDDIIFSFDNFINPSIVGPRLYDLGNEEDMVTLYLHYRITNHL